MSTSEQNTYVTTSTAPTSYTSEAIDESGNYINLFIKASQAPNLYVWDPNNGDRTLNGNWAGNKLTTQKRVTATANGAKQTFWYYRVPMSSLSGQTVNFIASNNDSNQSADMSVTGAGNYFYEYTGTGNNAALTNLTSTYVTTTTTPGTRVVPTTGTTEFVRVLNDDNQTFNNNATPFIWAWDSNQNKLTGTSWPGVQMTNTVTLTDGSKWFWWNTSNTNWVELYYLRMAAIKPKTSITLEAKH